MKRLALFLTASALSAATHAQTKYTDLLALDPGMANGYIIVDPAKAQGLGVAEVDVRVWADALDNGVISSRVIDQFTISDRTYGHADPQALAEIEPNETVRYQVSGLNGAGQTVFDHDGIPPGTFGWPPICSMTCNSVGYAWAVYAYTNGAQTVMDLQNGTENGSPFYFYVHHLDWAAFGQSHPPSEFGIGCYPDSWYAAQSNEDETDVFAVSEAPSDARDLLGFSLQPGAAWAIRKDRGPWRQLFAYTETYSQPSEVCDELVYIYNNDPLVENAMATLDLDPLICMGYFQDGEGSAPECLEIPIDGDLNAWVDEVLDCLGISDLSSTVLPQEVHGATVIQWATSNPEPWVDVVYPSERDPKLVPVPRTELEAGLYEFRIVLDDGRIIRHFEEFENDIFITASFAAFVGVVVYPVPVRETEFAIDFDLLAPMDIDLTIVNNMGTPYYTKALEFELAGLNKHVVEMTTQWPEGIYHAVFQYSDGSTESVSFTVEEN